MKNRRNEGLRLCLQGTILLLLLVMHVTSLAGEKTSVPEGEKVRGRVLAGVNYVTGYLRGGFGDSYEVFIFAAEPRSRSGSIAPLKVMYKFFYKRDSALPDSFFDFSKRFELLLVREPSCDETVENLSYQKNTDENGKPLPSTYILHPLDGAPTDVLKPDLVLSCYVLTPGKYKVLSGKDQAGGSPEGDGPSAPFGEMFARFDDSVGRGTATMEEVRGQDRVRDARARSGPKAQPGQGTGEENSRKFC